MTPGITLLEVLCYAITDLGYRSNLPIADLLAGGPENARDFYDVTEILPCNPVTITDLRKLILDHKVIRNAWVAKNNATSVNGLYDIMLELEEDEALGDLNFNILESAVTLNTTDYDFEVAFPFWDELSGVKESQEITGIAIATAENGSDIFVKIQDDPVQGRANDYYAELELEINGMVSSARLAIWIKMTSEVSENTLTDPLFQNTIKTDLIEGVLVNAYWQKIKTAIVKVDEVKAVLHAYRPLCEDFRSFRAFRVQEISIRADIDLSPGASADEVLAGIWHRIHAFLSPRPHFYTLEELLNKDRPVEAIFEGPLLRHGFIDTAELEALQRQDVIYISDLMQLLSDIPGLIAVKDLWISNHYNNDVLTPDVANCLKLVSPDLYKPQLSPGKSRISFYKNELAVTADTEAALLRFETLKNQARQEKKEAVYELPTPRGEDRAVENYFSIQHHFPPVYGIGGEQLPASAPKLRKAHVRQLKGYLLFFEQLLANYFAQLANIRSLFSMEASVTVTYFSQSLADLLPEATVLMTEDYEAKLPGMTEPLGAEGEPGVFHERRNRFLDHLMARFCESFSDYALFLYAATPDATTAAENLIADKIAFLQEYPMLSRDRSRAFNYLAQRPDENDPSVLVPDLWNTDNVSGLKKRIARLLGLESYHRGAENGFHLIEHLLLRPNAINAAELELPVDAENPYSFRISFVLPLQEVHEKWSRPDFRQYAEKVICSETPAHIIPHICWVDDVQMSAFEEAYRDWLEKRIDPEIEPTELSNARNLLIGKLNDIINAV